MRSSSLVILLAVATTCAFGQRGVGGGHPNPAATGGGRAGFGSVLFPGGAPGTAVVRPPGNITDTSFGSALGATVRGVPPRLGNGAPGRPGGPYRGGGGRTVVVPYPVLAAPAYYPYGYGYGYGSAAYGPDQQVYVEGGYQQQQMPMMQQQQPPVVIINQNYKPETVNPTLREYTNLPPGTINAPDATLKVYENRTGPLEDEKPTIFLIAMKDGNIMPALAFWVEGDTMHYITRESSHNRISLDRIDRDFSVRLNKERGLEFRVP